jgi:hypothetical protein
MPVTRTGSHGGAFIDVTSSTNRDNLTQNSLDDAALKIRSGAIITGPLPNAGRRLRDVIIYSVGLGAVNIDLLQRVCNDPSNPAYRNSQRPGLFILAPTAADISAAFSTVASDILRIAR